MQNNTTNIGVVAMTDKGHAAPNFVNFIELNGDREHDADGILNPLSAPYRGIFANLYGYQCSIDGSRINLEEPARTAYDDE